MQLAFPLPHCMRLTAMMQPWETRVTGADQTEMVRRADELGYEMVAVPEHLIVPKEHVPLSGPHYFHAAAAQAYLAGATRRIRINSALTILPLHHPITLAKALSTIDWMSSGRITVTFGVGWLEGEFDQLGVPFHERGAMADEYVAAIIELWTKEDPVFEGKYVRFRDVAFEPKPFQKPHLPIWMGGDSDAALRRTARFASGWIPFLTRPEQLPDKLDYIKSQPDFRGGPFEVMVGLAANRVGEGHVPLDDPSGRPGMSLQEIVDALGRLEELGATISSVPIPPLRDMSEYLEYAQWVIEEIKPRLQ
jgi:probable F420-dependent oxidoreductase